MEPENQSSHQLKAAWIGAIVAICLGLVTLIAQAWFHNLDKKAQREHELLEHRRTALFKALQVIDKVYANSHWQDLPQPTKEKWKITEARDAMNEMIVYSQEPNKTIQLFLRALGDSMPTNGFTPERLAEFREQVCKELALPVIKYDAPDKIWIHTLPGSE